ncbi:MAG: DEAD/DEAH box helicase [Rhodopirellula sp.]|nr:DEAD/DEAH box helicase [Rhodopirellula sp.]
MSFFGFHPLIERWFLSRFAEPTSPQRLGWPHIEQGENTLIAAPTGSGKTLTAFLAVIDRLLKESIAGKLEDGVRAIYVSPLRALSNDMHRNLSEPLEELNALAAAEFPDVPIASLRVGLRTGDSTPSQRAALVRKPPHIVVTTPESLFLLLTAEKGRAALKSVDTIIVDEIHALVRDKRGSHLALTIERLEALCERPLQRIGLSATQKPIERIAEFLVGSRRPDQAPLRSGYHEPSDIRNAGAARSLIRPTSEALNSETADCSIVNVGYSRDLDLKIEVPPSDLSAVCSTEQWGEINERIVELINSHRSTLIFVNTRRMAERVTHQLSEILGEDQVGSHHGSLSSAIRLKTEQQLKGGELKAVVATASLELGLDVGFIDLVIQIGSPRAIATFLQRVGRSGHSLGKTPKGRLFALTRDELVESMGLIRAIRAGRLDVIPIPECPIDVLAQQIVAEVACREWSTDELFALFCRAWPFRNLKRDDFDETLRFLSEGLTDRSGRGKVYLHQDLVQKRLRTRPGARIVATSNAGAIPEVAEFRVVAQPDGVVVGTLDEDFALESHAGQIILLGNTSWRMEGVRGTDVHVSDAGGVPPTVPFWRGEAPGRTLELSEEVSRLREELEVKLKALPETVIASWWEDAAAGAESGGETSEATLPATQTEFRNSTAAIVKWLVEATDCSDYAARQVVNYLAAQIAAVGMVPTQKRVIFERFFDESGGMQMVVHAPFGSRVTQAWGLSMRKRFCVSFDFELQATADDDGFILSLGPQHSFPLESMFPMLTSENAQRLLEQAILYIPMFQIRWRWNANRALLVPRRDKGKRIPPALQRFRADDLLSSVFPLLTGCQENVVGELKLPDHILLRQTMDDCLREALDIDGLVDVLRRVEAGEIEFIARDTREPSPFSYELLNSNPYAFLDGGELPERRARAVSTRRSLTVDSVSDLGRLDPLAIEQVTSEATPLVRNADELHDVLLTRIVVPDDEMEDWRGWLEQLVQQRRATSMTATGEVTVWTAAERIPAVRAMFPDSKLDPEIQTPDGVRLEWNDVEGRVAAMRGLLETSGPLTHEEAARRTGIKSTQAFAALEALEGEGIVLRGRFRDRKLGPAHQNSNSDDVGQGSTDSAGSDTPQRSPEAHSEPPPEWCHRRLLSRIHRLTMQGLRQQIQPVSPEVFLQFLTHHHGLTSKTRRAGVNGLFEVISLLQGYDLAAVCWERDILPARVEGYRPAWLDELCLSGEVAWRRLFPPKRDIESRSGVTRVVPVSIFLRGDQDWLAAASQLDEAPPLTRSAQAAAELLNSSGAMFAADLQQQLGLAGGTFQDVLGELITAGLLTADGFGGLRSLLAERGQAASAISRRRGLARRRIASGSIGRWSLWRRRSWSDQMSDGGRQEPVQSSFDVSSSKVSASGNLKPALPTVASMTAPLTHNEVVEQWAWQLLRRWGVVFRDLLEREAGTPRWWELLQVYRRLEARGEIRGGRFITGVAGEQFALGDTVKKLRQLRDATPDPGNRAISKTAGIRAGFLNLPDVTAEPVVETGQEFGREQRGTDRISPSDEVVILSAADPLNLVGIITNHSRVPATAHNRIALLNGKPIAALINGEVSFLDSVRATQRDGLARTLLGQIVDFASLESCDVFRDSEETNTANEQPFTPSRKPFVRPAIS